jgi:hypothetical protein
MGDEISVVDQVEGVLARREISIQYGGSSTLKGLSRASRY